MTTTPVEERYAYDLHPRQLDVMASFFEDDVEQLLYGGAAGGGKSHLARALAFTLAIAWPGARIPIFRENYTQLIKTQVSKWRLEMAAIGYDVNSPKVWHATDHEFHFPNGSIVEFLHIDQTIGAEKWLSAEWAALIVDEATQLTEEDLKMLYSRVRAPEHLREHWAKLADEREAQGGWRMDWRPLALYLTNPGGVSHSYFKSEFVDVGRANNLAPWTWKETVLVGAQEMDVEIRRCFVPAFLTDNPSLNAQQYAAQLAQIASMVRREQMLSGNWDAFEGKVFDVLNEEIHHVDASMAFAGKRVPPKDWPRIAGLDHGTTNPTAVEWTTRDEDGFFITYLEYYSPGHVGAHIEAIKELMMLDGHRSLGIIGDPRMWHKNLVNARGMHSLAEEYLFNGAPPEERVDMAKRLDDGIKLINPMKGQTNEDARRQTQRIVLQRLLEPDPNRMFPDWHPMRGQMGAPRWFISTACKNLWREMNALQYVSREGQFSEDTVKKDDHAYDAVARSVPIFEQALSTGGRRGMRREVATRAHR